VVSLFYALFSSGRVFFCCPLCVFVSILPFISPETIKIFIVKGFQAYRMYGIIKQLASKIKFEKVRAKSSPFKINELCGMLLFVTLSETAVFCQFRLGRQNDSVQRL
jgi:hypothetical protein